MTSIIALYLKTAKYLPAEIISQGQQNECCYTLEETFIIQ